MATMADIPVFSSSYSDWKNQNLEKTARIRSRPTKLAAEAFCSDSSWQSLPKLVSQLAQTLDDKDMRDVPSVSKNEAESKRIMLTAAVQVECIVRKHALHDMAYRCFRHFLDVETTVLGNEESVSFYANLRRLGWLPSDQGTASSSRSYLFASDFFRAIQDTVDSMVKLGIEGEYETAHMETLKAEFDSRLKPKLIQALGSQSTALRTLDRRIASSYVHVRSGEIFELIADYPDSHPGVEELKKCIDLDESSSFGLRHAVREALVRRLCHAGATTAQILDVYIHTIQVLRILDPSECLLAHCAEPVRQYLRTRKDTVRCITHSLVSGGDLQQSELRSDAQPIDQAMTLEIPPSLDWQPEPSIHAPKGSFLPNTSSTKAPDILAMLVSIYGSKDLFCLEYRNMLADKLLQSTDYATDEHVQTLELLKLRFGPSSLQNAQVMLKDMLDSKRTNTTIQSITKTETVDACMVSHIFWPSLPSDRVIHHPEIQQRLDEFAAAFAKLKNPRQLVWYPQLGNIDLQLQVIVNDRPTLRDFSVSPLLATLILHFQDHEEWTAKALSNETSVALTVILQKLQYWVHQSVLESSDGETYRLGNKDMTGKAVAMYDDDSPADATVLANTQDQEKMDIYWSYINGMLTNMGPLSLATIHNNLKTFAAAGSEVSYDQTPQMLSSFLQSLDHVECGPDGLYKLVK